MQTIFHRRVRNTTLGVAIIAAAACLAVTPTLTAETVVAADFKTPKRISDAIRIEDGALKLDGQSQKSVASYRLGEGLSLDKFVFRFKARAVKKSATDDSHFGMIFQGEGNKRLQLYTRGIEMTYLSGPGTEGTVGGGVKMACGPDAAWTEFMVTVNANFIEVNVDRSFVGTFTFDIVPIKSIDLYACQVDVEIQECVAESLADAKAGGSELDQQQGGPPDFFASFDGTASATSATGEAIAPAKASGLSFTEGLRGKALQIGNTPVTENGKTENPYLQYDGKTLFDGPNGALSFWFKPDWDGRDDLTDRFLLKGWDAQGQEALNFWFWNWLRLDLPRRGLSTANVNSRVMRNSVFKDDWTHIAVVWRQDGWVKLFIDGLPYRHDPACWTLETPGRFANIDMSAIQSLALGSGGNTTVNAAGAFDEFKIYRRALADDEVVAEYRAAMPVDILLDRSVLFADKDETLELLVAPGGHFVRPAVGTGEPVKAAIELGMELVEDEGGRVVHTNKASLNIDHEQRAGLPVGKLSPGVYRLKCTVAYHGSRIQKSFLVVSHLPQAPMAATDADLATGAPIFVKDFAKDGVTGVLHEGEMAIRASALGNYLEAGGNNGGRVGFEIKIPESLLNGRPAILEVKWPDDKPRSMGLYLYPKADSVQHRDRLEGGIQSGNEYPLTNTLQTTRYLFYPGVDSYLFEARTMITGFPAAISEVKVYPLASERLPRLKIEYPAGMAHRRLGHMDEDQTVDIMLNYDDAKERRSAQRTGKVLERWCDYFDYTGQNAISYPVLRYGYICYPLAGFYGNGCFPSRPGELATFIEMFTRRGSEFIAIDNLYSLPEFVLDPERTDEFLARGYFVMGADGKPAKSGHLGYPKPNLLHPEVMDLFLAHIREIATRYGRMPGFDGIEIWPSFIALRLDEGYGDQTVELFAKETGVVLPEAATDKYQERHAFLVGPARDAWLRWRANKITEQIRQIAQTVQAVNPKLKIYVNILKAGSQATLSGKTTEGTEDETADGQCPAAWCYENTGLDFAGIGSLPNVYFTPTRPSTAYRHGMFWGYPESTVDEEIFDFKAFAPYIKDGVAYSNTYPTYFETFKQSLKQDVYAGYFQNADIKPFGRYFLKELVYPLAMMDAQRILIGAQPLGTWGRDAETREFAKAYCALPAQPFTEIAGMRDPVTARFLDTPHGTYLYTANLIWSDCTVELKLRPGAAVRDLSTGETLAADGKGNFGIKLKPYQLRSFLVACKPYPFWAALFGSKHVAISKGSIDVPDTTVRFYAQRLDALRNAMATVAKSGVNIDRHRARIERMQGLMDAGTYAEIHRLIFSKQMNSLEQLSKVAAEGFLKEQAAMMAESRYAVKCGGNEYAFYRAKAGTLFFPDRSFAGDTYGYDGNYKSVIRNIDTIKGAADPEIYKTEAYDLEAYRFKVKPGKYTVRLYFKIGYEPNAELGINVINLDIEKQRVLDAFDIFQACGSDFNTPLVKEFNGIQVEDGVLDVEFSVPEGGEPTIRFCNAIEVIPE
jgi:hypothetical protein